MRDLRLDFFRGLALFSIFIDHIPNNVCRYFTIQAIGISDAAEVFILISGYAAGMVYGGIYQRASFVAATARALQRVWQIYVAHIFLFMLFMATVAKATSGLNTQLFAEEFRAADFLTAPDLTIIRALTLQFQPMFMDILPLYIVLLCMLPVALLGFRHAPWVAFVVIGGLWLAAQLDPRVALKAYPGVNHVWFFNPFAWQALFLFGAYFGARGAIPQGRPPEDQRWIFPLAALVAFVCFALKIEWTVSNHFEIMTPLFLKQIGPYLSKTDMSPVRYVNVVALAVVVACVMAPQSKWFKLRVAWPFLVCGRHSLEIFCLGILLSVLAHFGLTEFLGNAPLMVAVSIGGIVLMVGVAALIDWVGAVGSKRAAPGASAIPASGGRE
ncbi:MAG: OpgC domain-containing protein [Rhodospirillaceae bacterium]